MAPKARKRVARKVSGRPAPPVLRGAAEGVVASLVEGHSLQASALQPLRDALLAENADASPDAADRCARVRAGFAAAVREALAARPATAALAAPPGGGSPRASPPVRVEVRQTAGRTVSHEAFVVGRAPECDVQASGDVTVSKSQFVVISLPCCIIVVDGWSASGTRIVRRSGPDPSALPSSVPSKRAAFAVPHGERVILLIGSRTTVTLGPAAGGENVHAALPAALAPPAAAAGPPQAAALAEAPPASPPAAGAATEPAASASANGAASPCEAKVESGHAGAAAASVHGTAESLWGSGASPTGSREAAPESCHASAAATAVRGAAGSPLVRGASPSGSREVTSANAATHAAAARNDEAEAAAGPASGAAPGVAAAAGGAAGRAGGGAAKALGRCLAAVRAGVRMQHAAAAHGRLRWRCLAARRARLLTEDQCAELRDRLSGRAAWSAADEVADILDGLGVPAAPDEVLPQGAPAWTCPVCRGLQRARGWYCPFKHRYCRKCMVQWAEARPLPTCPHEGCGYHLGDHDLEDLRAGAGRTEALRAARLEQGLAALQQDPESQVAVFRCPGSGCSAAVVLGVGEARRRWECSCGAPSTCTGCGGSPYHHHAQCGDMQSLRARWLAWLQGGREAYRGLQRRVVREAGAQTRALREAMARHSELERDEQWKAENCRCCPRCRRPTEKIGGCNTMVCGQNAHGGNRQPGCGHRFHWGDARPYRAAGAPSRAPRAPAHARAGAISGRGVRHLFAQCALCDSGKCITGPRFRCVHCPNFSCCLKCEERLATEHEAGHVFEIMFEDEFDWTATGVELPSGTRARIRGGAAPAEGAEGGASAGPGGGSAPGGPPSGGRKRQRDVGAGMEGVVKGRKRGRYVLELAGGMGTRHVEPRDLQPLLTQRQAERLLAAVSARPAAEGAAAAAAAGR